MSYTDKELDEFIGKKITFTEHAKHGTMWLGTFEAKPISTLVYDPQTGLSVANIFISDAALKYVEEMINNVVDHFIKTQKLDPKLGGPVTEIRVATKLGSDRGDLISISNNGIGFPIRKMESGRWNVDVLINDEFSGTNFTDSNVRATGGTNGIGMKAVNAMSEYFEVETIDLTSKQIFRWNSADREPKVEVYSGFVSGTTFRFSPKYKDLVKGQSLTMKDRENFFRAVNARIALSALFANTIEYTYYHIDGTIKTQSVGHLKALINDLPISVTPDLVLKPFLRGTCQRVKLERRDQYLFPWNLYWGLASEPRYIGVLNGIMIGNPHPCTICLIRKIIDNICKQQAKFKELTARQINKVTDMLIARSIILDIKQYYVKYLMFDSQTKTRASLSDKESAALVDLYTLPAAVITGFWNVFGGTITDCVSEILKKKGKPATITHKITTNYDPAANINKKGSVCYLFIPEGESAQKPIDSIISKQVSGISSANYGRYNLQGVIMNTLKNTNEIADGISTYIEQTDAFKQSDIIQRLVEVIGLDYNESYSLDAAGDAAFAKLKYKKIFIATDQDWDGIGQICSLLLIFILRFWIALFDRGFVCRLRTPLIRAYVGDDVYCFYNKQEYIDWQKSHEFPGQKPRIYYYKGLSTHSAEEVIEDIGKKFHQNIITFTRTGETMSIAQKFYGKDTSHRKVFLSTKKVDPDIQNPKSQTITCDEHFLSNTLAFQFVAIDRKLPCYIDGLIPSQRKVLCAMRRYGGHTCKVYVLCAYTTLHCKYQQGDTSLNQAIIKMAQCFIGSNVAPILLPISNGYGDRKGGRSSTGAPRYLDVGYNKLMDILYPRIDDQLLPKVNEEGTECEPGYYCPILPRAIMETYTTASPGFRIESWARETSSVIGAVRQMIAMDRPGANNNSDIVAVCRKAGSGYSTSVFIPRKVRIVHAEINGRTCDIQLGSYEYNPNSGTIVITELPIKVWSVTRRDILIKKYGPAAENVDNRVISDIIDDTSDDDIKVTITLRKGGYDRLIKIGSEMGYKGVGDEIINALELYHIAHHDINMIDEFGLCRSYTSYSLVIVDWYEKRRELYKKRIERTRIRIMMQLELYKNKLRYITMRTKNEINIDEKSKADRTQILEAAGFAKLDETFLTEGMLHCHDNSVLMENFHNGNYKYIDDIKDGKKSRESVDKLIAKIADLEKQLLIEQDYRIIWLEEIAKYEEKFNEGIRTRWTYRDKTRTFK